MRPLRPPSPRKAPVGWNVRPAAARVVPDEAGSRLKPAPPPSGNGRMSGTDFSTPGSGLAQVIRAIRSSEFDPAQALVAVGHPKGPFLEGDTVDPINRKAPEPSGTEADPIAARALGELLRNSRFWVRGNRQDAPTYLLRQRQMPPAMARTAIPTIRADQGPVVKPLETGANAGLLEACLCSELTSVGLDLEGGAGSETCAALWSEGASVFTGWGAGVAGEDGWDGRLAAGVALGGGTCSGNGAPSTTSMTPFIHGWGVQW